MPVYVYRCDSCGEVEERIYPVAERKSSIKCGVCGKQAGRDYCGEHDKNNTKPSPWNSPMYSNALGVAPSQVKEAEARYREAGCPTDFTKDGRAIIRSRNHRNRLLRLNQMRDRDAGYGDYAGKRM